MENSRIQNNSQIIGIFPFEKQKLVKAIETACKKVVTWHCREGMYYIPPVY